jgi:plastocyanin
MSESDQSSRGSSLTGKVLNRRSLLKCAAWAGTGVVWTMRGGLLGSVDLVNAARAAEMAKGFSFVQISDSHIGFNKEPNPTPHVTLQSAIDQIKALPNAPAFVVHTGDVSQLSKPEEFDTAMQIIKGVGRDVHYIPGEHDTINDNGVGFFTRFNGSAEKKWYSFDADGAHFVALVNVLDLKAGGFGQLGHEQLEWLEKDLKGRSSSTPIVVLAHMPMWTVSSEWGWGTDDAPAALSYLKRFGSVTMLNGHIHQVIRKVEGNVQFHTARSTAFPQAAPGTPGANPGPWKVQADMLRSTLGISSVTRHVKDHPLAIVDAQLQAGMANDQPRKVSIGNFVFNPQKLEVAAGTKLVFVNEDDVPHTVIGSDPGSPLRSPALDTDDKYTVAIEKPGTYSYFCSLHPHMTGSVTVKG